jgi:hypothetical protein
MKEVLSSANEAELASLFHNPKEAFPVCTSLAKIGYPQNIITITTDNSTATGITSATVR